MPFHSMVEFLRVAITPISSENFLKPIDVRMVIKMKVACK